MAIIVGAIVALEKPFSSGSSDEADETVAVFDVPEDSGQAGEISTVSREELVAALATPGSDPGTPAPTLQDEPTVVPTPVAVEVTPTPPPAAKVAEGPKAQELRGIVAWINSEPLKVEELKGKVVLVDFWTYTCVNCIRTFPFLKLWHAKYADDGLVILGVHTPEFEIEKNPDNVRKAVKDNGIGWPVAMDNDYSTWRAYRNRYWPAKYLIDKDGIIRYTHFGEGAYAETETKIRELLEEAGADLSQLDAALPGDQSLDSSFTNNPFARPTRELYAGWERGYNDYLYGRGGYVGDPAYFNGRDQVVGYFDPGEHEEHLLYLEGPWLSDREFLRHGRETTDFEDYMFLRFSARSVNAVIGLEGDEPAPFKVLVTLEGEYLTEDTKGDDVVIEEDGRSFLFVDEPRLYSIIQAPSYSTYELKLSSNSPHFAIFAFTFGVYESGV